MEQIDIDAAKRMKERMWSPALKEFYEPKDVLRYFEERKIIENYPNNNRHIIEPEEFFTKEVLEQGLLLLKK